MTSRKTCTFASSGTGSSAGQDASPGGGAIASIFTTSGASRMCSSSADSRTVAGAASIQTRKAAQVLAFVRSLP